MSENGSIVELSAEDWRERVLAALRADGQRLTASRRAIIGWLATQTAPFSAEALTAALACHSARVGRATAYRFYDKRLSANGAMACASCHVQALAFSDGRATPHGSTGKALLRNTQGLTNVACYSALTWAAPVLTELERQILVPLFGEFAVATVHTCGVARR